MIYLLFSLDGDDTTWFLATAFGFSIDGERWLFLDNWQSLRMSDL